jgi:hypothetical protein
MLNRPSTRIELKLEDDLIELEETKELRQTNYFKTEDVNYDDISAFKEQFTPEQNKQDNYSDYQPAQFNIRHNNNIPINFTPKQSDSSPISEDISMR